ncbi:hypothetical protein RCH12_003450, partial [Cryobacterium sp. MP_3.1]|nr:hypothetical protein [Cryobacterium sp. MP_3.1]
MITTTRSSIRVKPFWFSSGFEPSRVSCRRFVGGFDIYRAVCFSVVVAFIFL